MADERYWTHPSVRALAGDRDPVQVIVERARELALQAMDEGWAGPPFDPFELADRLGVTVVARQELEDARTVPIGGGKVRIEFNPTRPRGRLRFSVAHELAHTFFPDVAEAVRHRGGTVRDDWQLELLCNIAAAELLMPIGTFQGLGSEPLDINHLMRLRKAFAVSTEALLRRVVRLTPEPTSFFAASRVDGDRVDARFRLEYVEASHAWRAELRRGQLLPEDTLLRHCTAVGYTESGVENWQPAGEVHIQAAGVGAYPGQRFPRVAGLLSPCATDVAAPRVIHYVDGDATQPRGAGRKVIAHLVNDKTPNWGGAFARALRDRYPAAQNAFREWVGSDPRNLRLGQTHFANLSDELAVATMVAQRGYGAARTARVSYAALRQCLSALGDGVAERGATLHLPRVGVGMAGGKWAVVSELIDDALVTRDLDVTVYTLPGVEFDPGEPELLQLPL